DRRLAAQVRGTAAGLQRDQVGGVPVVQVPADRVELVRGDREVPAKLDQAQFGAVPHGGADVEPFGFEPGQRGAVEVGENWWWSAKVGRHAVYYLEGSAINAAVCPAGQGQQDGVDVFRHRALVRLGQVMLGAVADILAGQLVHLVPGAAYVV